MSEIQLEEGTINVDGEWLSADELKQRIQEKMQSGDMKLTALAAALEELNAAIENSQALEIKLVLPNEIYEKLKAFGGDDDRESVRKAIMTFIGSDGKKAGSKKMLVVKCPQCKGAIEVKTEERPTVVECPQCGTSGRLTAKNKWAKLDGN